MRRLQDQPKPGPSREVISCLRQLERAVGYLPQIMTISDLINMKREDVFLYIKQYVNNEECIERLGTASFNWERGTYDARQFISIIVNLASTDESEFAYSVG